MAYRKKQITARNIATVIQTLGSACSLLMTSRDAGKPGSLREKERRRLLGVVLGLAQHPAALVLGGPKGALHLVCDRVDGLLGLVAALLQGALRVVVLVALHRRHTT